MKNVRMHRWIRAAALAAFLLTVATAQVRGVSDVLLPAPDPCSILTGFEVSVAVGLPVPHGTLLFRNGSSLGCSYTRAGGDRIVLLVFRVASAEWLAEQAGRMYQGSILGSYQQIHTIGERAFFFGKRSTRPVLCVFKDPYYLQLSIPGVTDEEQSEAALQTLARAVLRRLPPSPTLRADSGRDIGSQQ